MSNARCSGSTGRPRRPTGAPAPSPARRPRSTARSRLVAPTTRTSSSVSTAELKAEIDNQINQQFALFNAIVVIAVIVSLLGVVNTLAMSVIERTREIGVLRALGSSALARALRACVDESLLLTLAGAVVGVLSGVW